MEGDLGELIMYVCQSSERKVTNKVALNGYAYTKRGGKGNISYWYCDQRKICSASLIEKNGAFTCNSSNISDSRRSKRGWGACGNHESHPPDVERIDKEISTRSKRLEKRKRAKERQAARQGVIQPEKDASTPNCTERNLEGEGENDDCNNSLRINHVWGHNSPDLLHISQSQSSADNAASDASVIPVLIDTDGGFYDAWALTLALKFSKLEGAHKNFKIVGITTVNGCTTVDNAVQNVGRVLNTVGEGQAQVIPVFKGMESPLLVSKEKTPRPAFFGKDGFGDTLPPLSSEEKLKVVSDHAVNAIIKFSEKYKSKLTILALGPLTNLAMAVKLQPAIKNYVKEIFIMGGNSEGMGNITVCGEFNFYADPEAAHIVFENFTACPLYLLPWETCMRSAASSQEFRTKTIAELNTPVTTLLNKVESKNLSKHDDHWVAPDAVVVACFMNPEIMKKVERYHCAIELQGKHTRGMTIVDKHFVNQKPPNAVLITEVDREMYEKILMRAVGHDSNYSIQENQFGMKLELEQNYF